MPWALAEQWLDGQNDRRCLMDRNYRSRRTGLCVHVRTAQAVGKAGGFAKGSERRRAMARSFEIGLFSGSCVFANGRSRHAGILWLAAVLFPGAVNCCPVAA